MGIAFADDRRDAPPKVSTRVSIRSGLASQSAESGQICPSDECPRVAVKLPQIGAAECAERGSPSTFNRVRVGWPLMGIGAPRHLGRKAGRCDAVAVAPQVKSQDDEVIVSHGVDHVLDTELRPHHLATAVRESGGGAKGGSKGGKVRRPVHTASMRSCPEPGNLLIPNLRFVSTG